MLIFVDVVHSDSCIVLLINLIRIYLENDTFCSTVSHIISIMKCKICIILVVIPQVAQPNCIFNIWHTSSLLNRDMAVTFINWFDSIEEEWRAFQYQIMLPIISHFARAYYYTKSWVRQEPWIILKACVEGLSFWLDVWCTLILLFYARDEFVCHSVWFICSRKWFL